MTGLKKIVEEAEELVYGAKTKFIAMLMERLAHEYCSGSIFSEREVRCRYPENIKELIDEITALIEEKVFEEEAEEKI